MEQVKEEAKKENIVIPPKTEDDDIDKDYKKIVSNLPEEVKGRFIALKSIAVIF